MKGALLLTVAILAGLGAMFLVRQHLQDAKGDQIVVFRTTTAVAAGDPIGGRVEPLVLPAGYYPNLLREAPTADMADYVRNTPLARPVGSGEVVLYRHFDTALEPRLENAIPAGHKAMTIAVDEISSVAFHVEPGDLVDILATARIEKSKLDFNKPMVQAVPVLATGSRFQGRRGRRDSGEYGTVTLLVTMEEAQKLSLIRDEGARLTLLLRSPDDGNSRTGVVSAVAAEATDFDMIGNAPRGGDPERR